MPSFELYLQLANMIVIQWMSMFFYSVSLWVIAVQIIIMFGYYWGQKYNFIRKRCIGIQNQYRLIKVTMDLIEVSLCLFCVSLLFIILVNELPDYHSHQQITQHCFSPCSAYWSALHVHTHWQSQLLFLLKKQLSLSQFRFSHIQQILAIR